MLILWKLELMAKSKLNSTVLESENVLNEHEEKEKKSIAKIEPEFKTSKVQKSEKESTTATISKTVDSESNETKSSDIIDFELKFNKNLKLHNERLHKTLKRKAKILDEWVKFILELDDKWYKATKSESIDTFQHLILILENPPKFISKNELRTILLEVTDDQKVLIQKNNKIFLSYFKNSDFTISGEFPSYQIHQKNSKDKDDISNSVDLSIRVLDNPDRRNSYWKIEIDDQVIDIEKDKLLDSLTSFYETKYYSSLNNIDITKIFLSVMQQLALFSRQDQIQVYLQEFFDITRNFLVQNHFLTNQQFIIEQFEKSFDFLAQKFNCKLNFARDKNKFVKLRIDDREDDYSYLIFFKSTILGDNYAST